MVAGMMRGRGTVTLQLAVGLSGLRQQDNGLDEST